MISEDARTKISEFLSQYIEMIEDDPIPKTDIEFISGIELLLRERVFENKQDLRRECALGYGVIIPDYLFGVYEKT